MQAFIDDTDVISAYPASTRQIWYFFQPLLNAARRGISTPWYPEFVAESRCRCMCRDEDHEPAATNRWRPCMHSWCPCWKFRPLVEAPTAPFLPGMEIVNHATPVRR